MREIIDWVPVEDKKRPSEGEKVLVIQNPKTTATRTPLFAIYSRGEFIPPEYYQRNSSTTRWSDILYWTALPQIPNILIPKPGVYTLEKYLLTIKQEIGLTNE
jgi:hypothetical protein